MNHIFTKNGVVTYELLPTDDDDRHVIEMMKSRSKLTMRQSSKGGLIIEMERAGAVAEEGDSPVDLSGLPGKTGGKS